jgi:hypothetical protein
MRPTQEVGIVNHRATEASRGSHASKWQVEMVIDRGYALATAYYGDIEPDFPLGWKMGLRAALGERGTNTVFKPEDWGALGAWAWGLSRAMDYLEREAAVDSKRVAVIGHSRLKAAEASLPSGTNDLTFFGWSDQHVLPSGEATHLYDAIDAMNALPGTSYPERCGGTVAKPAFVFGCGDMTEWPSAAARDAYTELTSHRLKWPSFEILGNHDEGGNSPAETMKQWSIHKLAPHRRQFGRGELVRVSPGCESEIIRRLDLRLGGNADRECFAGHDVPVTVGGLPQGGGYARRLRAADAAPGSGHYVGLALLVIGADHKHPVHERFGSKRLLHSWIGVHIDLEGPPSSHARIGIVHRPAKHSLVLDGH